MFIQTIFGKAFVALITGSTGIIFISKIHSHINKNKTANEDTNSEEDADNENNNKENIVFATTTELKKQSSAPWNLDGKKQYKCKLQTKEPEQQPQQPTTKPVIEDEDCELTSIFEFDTKKFVYDTKTQNINENDITSKIKAKNNVVALKIKEKLAKKLLFNNSEELLIVPIDQQDVEVTDELFAKLIPILRKNEKENYLTAFSTFLMKIENTNDGNEFTFTDKKQTDVNCLITNNKTQQIKQKCKIYKFSENDTETYDSATFIEKQEVTDKLKKNNYYLLNFENFSYNINKKIDEIKIFETDEKKYATLKEVMPSKFLKTEETKYNLLSFTSFIDKK